MRKELGMEILKKPTFQPSPVGQIQEGQEKVTKNNPGSEKTPRRCIVRKIQFQERAKGVNEAKGAEEEHKIVGF